MAELQHSKWIQSIKLHDSLDLYDDDNMIQQWCYVKVIDINDEQVLVHFYGWGNNYNEWINKANSINKLAPLNKYTAACIILNQPKEFYHTGILYENKKESKKYIICLSEEHVVKYDITMDKYKTIATLPSHIDYHNHKFQTLIKNNELYILYVIYHNENKLIVSVLEDLHLETGKWKIDKLSVNVCFYGWRGAYYDGAYYFGAYYDKTSNKIHLLCSYLTTHDVCHLIYDIQQKQCTVDVSTVDDDNCKVIYADSLEDKSKFILIKLKKTYELFCYNVLDCDFKKLNIDLVGAKYVRNAIVIYDELVLVLADDGIWIADMKYNKWYKNDKIMPGYFSTQTINTKDNYVHFIGGLNDDTYLYHLKVDLFDLIPKDLVDYHLEYVYCKLVTVFINYNIKMLKLQSKYPHDITNIILSYFPVFLY